MAELKNTVINDTGTIGLPSGTTAQRPTDPPEGAMRYNTDLGYTEVYINRAWSDLAAGRGMYLPRDGMQLELSYDDPASWPGSGTTWFDTSGNSRNFTLSTTAGTVDTGQQAFNFSTGDRNAIYGVNSSDLPGVPGPQGQCTYVCVTRVLNSTSEWRTLTRSWSSDHHVIFESGAWRIGMYDNDGSGFLTDGASQQNMHGYPDGYQVCVWRWSDGDQPTYAMNCNSAAGDIHFSRFNNSAGRYNRGFSILGGYHDGSNDPNVGSQPWGWIKYFSCYNRRLRDNEVQMVIQTLRNRYGC